MMHFVVGLLVVLATPARRRWCLSSAVFRRRCSTP
jgi:hypothetical protein